jgi:prepilin-type N-terminal cleavage/methylation domain-containing protein
LVCRRATDRAGFSLVELLIVLAIMGLLGAFALPSLIRLGNRTNFSLNRQDLERQLDALPMTAAAQGRNLVLSSTPQTDGFSVPADPASDPYPVTLPAGWRITVEAPITYRYDGTCSGGALHVTAPDAEARYLMKPPLCELRPG